MFLYVLNHKNTSKFFLFFGFSVQKRSEKKERANKKYLYYALFYAIIVSFSNKISVLYNLRNR